MLALSQYQTSNFTTEPTLYKNQFKKNQRRQPLVVHAYNPGYSWGRDQEDRSSNPAWANSSLDPISKKKKITKKG
jgi:hypothetical protein